MTRTSFQDDFDREVERQAREDRCNDRAKASGSTFLTCLECGTGPCKLATPTQITPATDAQISEWEYEAEQPHPNHQDWRILQLCARIKAERETARAELSAIVSAWEALPGGRQQSIRDVERWLANDMKPAIDHIRALLTNKGEQR